MAATENGPKLLHIAIIGGGIGGLALAIGLSKYAHLSFTIYEATSAFGEIGAGVGFGANSRRAMGLISPAFDFTWGEWGENEGKRIIEVQMENEMTQSTAHRAEVLEEFIKLVPEGTARFGKRLIEVDQDGEKVVCRFMDGTEAVADAVVGCDGVRSACRGLVYGEDSEYTKPLFTQKVVYRGLLPMSKAIELLGEEKAVNRQMYLGHGGHVITYPVSKGEILNVAAYHSSQSGTWEGDWVKPLQKENMERDYAALLIDNPSVWPCFELPKGPNFHKSRLCLLGDAAHTTSPHFGAGAGMALEDAYVLCNLLGHCKSTADILDAFKAYEFVRVLRTHKVMTLSLEFGKVLDMEGDGVGDDLEKLAKYLDVTVRTIWNEDLEAHLGQAVEKFTEEKELREAT